MVTGDGRAKEDYLAARTLRWSAWWPPRPGWDHDHCAFCWAKFAEAQHAHARHAPLRAYLLNRGYCSASSRPRIAGTATT